VQVRCSEGVAIHTGPESCAPGREARGEALTGGRMGQPSSRERVFSRAPTSSTGRKATWSEASARATDQPGVVEDPGTCARSLRGNREISSPTTGPQGRLVRIGKARSRSR
jgi:hypothetical protein